MRSSQNSLLKLLFGLMVMSLIILILMRLFEHRPTPQLNPVSSPIFSEKSQESHTTTTTTPIVLTSIPLIFKGITSTLTLTCEGTKETVEAGLEASGSRDYCVGRSLLSLQTTSTNPDWIISDTYATSSQPAPSLWNAFTLDDTRVVISYFEEDFSANPEKYNHFAPFPTPPNLLINIAKRTIHQLYNFPFEGSPVWNQSKTYAAFPGGEELSGGPYPLIGYHVNSDTRFDIAPAPSEGPTCENGDEICRQTVIWKNIHWKNDLTLAADLVDSSSTKHVEAVLPDITVLENSTYPIDLNYFGQPAGVNVKLKDGINPAYVVHQGLDKSGQPYTETGYAHLDDARLITDIDHDGRVDVLLSVRINTGGTGNWSYPFIALNKPNGYEFIPVKVDLGDRDGINFITIDDTGLITYDLFINDAQNSHATQKYRYTNKKWLKISTITQP